LIYEFDGRKPSIGRDTYVSETAIVIGDVRIGDNCYIGHGAVLRGDYGSIEIGSGTAVEEGVIVHAPPQKVCRIGEKVTIGHGAIIHAGLVGHRSVIGMGAVLSINSEVGENTIVAEGAVVKMRQILPGSIVAGGNPARMLRKIRREDEEYWGAGTQLYSDLAKKCLRTGLKRMD
jgi:carbonic anhydrase/acetyltransferase-like protein (isoleucine patch superfamily)